MINGVEYTEPSTTLVVNENNTVQAFFLKKSPEGEYTLTAIPVGKGWILVDPLKEKYSHGEEVELIANRASECWAFQFWTGDVIDPNPKITVTMDSTKTLYAIFYERKALPTIKLEPYDLCTNEASMTFEFTFSSAYKDVHICEVTTEVSTGTYDLDVAINKDKGKATLEWTFGDIDCVTLYATITVEDCCGNWTQELIEIEVDNVPPNVETFNIDLEASPTCNTATYTTIDWYITDGSYDKLPCDLQIGELEVSHGILTSDLSDLTGYGTSTEIYESSAASSLYWVFEDHNHVIVTATLTAWDVCCEDCPERSPVFFALSSEDKRNYTVESEQFLIDNVDPYAEIDFEETPACSATSAVLSWSANDTVVTDPGTGCLAEVWIEVSHGWMEDNSSTTTNLRVFVAGTDATNTADGTLTWYFDNLDCVTIVATITAIDCCGNTATDATQEITVDNVNPLVHLGVSVFEIVNSLEATLTWAATDNCFDRVYFEVSYGAVIRVLLKPNQVQPNGRLESLSMTTLSLPPPPLTTTVGIPV